MLKENRIQKWSKLSRSFLQISIHLSVAGRDAPCSTPLVPAPVSGRAEPSVLLHVTCTLLPTSCFTKPRKPDGPLCVCAPVQDALASFYTINPNRLGRRALEFYTQPFIYLFMNSVFFFKNGWMDTCYFTLYKIKLKICQKKKEKKEKNLAIGKNILPFHSNLMSLQYHYVFIWFYLALFFLLCNWHKCILEGSSSGVNFSCYSFPSMHFVMIVLHWNKKVKQRYKKTSGWWTLYKQRQVTAELTCSSCRHVATGRVSLYFTVQLGRGGFDRGRKRSKLWDIYMWNRLAPRSNTGWKETDRYLSYERVDKQQQQRGACETD